MITYEQVFKNNEKWAGEKLANDPDYFKKLASGQAPAFLYIGCSDSRVPPEIIGGAEPGEFFVHRNVANMVINTDLNVMSVIDYAITHLKVKHVVVCGHTECGGVKAAITAANMGGLLNPYVRNIRDVYRLHQAELDRLEGNARYNRLIELNAREQCINIAKTAVYQQAYIDRKGPELHAWVFDLHTGKIIDQNFNIHDEMKDIKEIYNLFGEGV